MEHEGSVLAFQPLSHAPGEEKVIGSATSERRQKSEVGYDLLP